MTEDTFTNKQKIVCIYVECYIISICQQEKKYIHCEMDTKLAILTKPMNNKIALEFNKIVLNIMKK